MRSWKVYLAISLVFLSGAIVGGVVTATVIRQRIDEVVFGGAAGRISKRLAKELRLSPPQFTEVDRVLNETEEQILELRKRNAPEAEAIIDKGVERLKGVLDQNQMERLQELREQQRARKKERERRWHRR